MNSEIKNKGICKCGHSYEEHFSMTMNGADHSVICVAENADDCIEFELNNLSYLESKYDEQMLLS